ncbi:MAG: CRISPR-associated endonuclease Cas6, partial [Chitinophagaceae bacterium]|nr:CRISPR-associated endonuclease Cas6 [Chitinophagaceae bacterium]
KLLEKILVQHIEKLATDNKWDLHKKVKVFLGQISHIEHNQFKYKNHLAFDCTYGANILLPEEIGLGNSHAFGFGKIQYLPVYAASQKSNKADVSAPNLNVNTTHVLPLQLERE